MLHPPHSPKILALRRYPPKCRLENLPSLCQLKAWFLAISVIGNHFSRQRTFDEDDFAVRVGNPAAFLIKGFDDNRSNHAYAGEYESGACARGARQRRMYASLRPLTEKFLPVRFGGFAQGEAHQFAFALILFVIQNAAHELEA